MTNRSLWFAASMAVIASMGIVRAADTAATAPAIVPNSDSQYAHELFRLKQIDVIKSQQAAAKGAAQEALWKSEWMMAQFDAIAKEKGDAGKVAGEYLAALQTYLASEQTPGDSPTPSKVDGAWAMDHAQFILSKLAQPMLTRLEYFGNNRHDRDALAPYASLADRLLKTAGANLDAALKQLESTKPFDEKAYARGYAATAEVRYYGAWCLYFSAMAMDPGDSVNRQKLLKSAVDALGEWAVDDTDNGVNAQAYLLRGKASAEAGDFAKAITDFEKAESEKAPDWVQYQARYQTVVANLRAAMAGPPEGMAKGISKAQTSYDAFKKWIPKDNADAQLSADLLGFRLVWTQAEAKTDAGERHEAERNAMDKLTAIMARDARYRDLVYQQVAAITPDDADVSHMTPLQQLSVARISSENQKGDTPESKQQLKRAADAALAARKNTAAGKTEKLEATFLAGVCEALLGNLQEAAGYNVEFATLAPTDPRARQMLDLALQQIGDLRKAAQATGGDTLPKDLSDLANKALALSTGTFGDKKWLYAQGRMLEESGKPADAATAYQAVAPDDRNYLDARYRLVVLATDRFSQLSSQKASDFEQHRAATALFDVCSKFIDLLDHPPASAPKDVLDAARQYRFNIWLIETATAINPAVKQPDVAIDRLTKLEAAKDQLTEAQRSTVLRYRILAYQMAGQADKARDVVQAYIKAKGADAMKDIRAMALSTVDEIDRAESSDPAKARQLAANVVQLLDPIITQADADAQGNDPKKKDTAFDYRLIQADMMVRAGQYKEAQALANELQGERPADIRGYLAEARAIFAQAHADRDASEYAKAQDYYTRIMAKLAPGGESYWESWLRIIQSMEAQTTASSAGAVGDEIRKRLGDLKGVYGEKFGGEHFAADFREMAEKYGVH